LDFGFRIFLREKESGVRGALRRRRRRGAEEKRREKKGR